MRVADVVAHLDAWYPPHWAESWDRVGLVCGDPADEVDSVLFAVDPVAEVAEEALDLGAGLVVVHHPLLLTPVSSVAATSAQGRIIHRLTRAGIALFTAHTNADVPVDGVNHALAAALGVHDAVVLAPTDDEGLDLLVTYVPDEYADVVRAALSAAGAGALGEYDGCSFSVTGEGRFRPLDGARPTIGEVGTPSVVPEARIEVSVPARLRAQVLEALRAAHPYEEVAFSILPAVPMPSAASDRRVTGPSQRGHGRIGSLATPTTLASYAAVVTGALPQTAHGVRVAGDPERPVNRVAVLAGSGESLLERAFAAGADVVVTSDLKHHRTSEFREATGCAVIDVAHWAAESTWLPVVAAKLGTAVGDRLGLHVSTRVTDPWTFRG